MRIHVQDLIPGDRVRLALRDDDQPSIYTVVLVREFWGGRTDLTLRDERRTFIHSLPAHDAAAGIELATTERSAA